MKKFLAIAVLFFMLATNAFAVDPIITPYVVGSAVFHTAVAVAGLYYYMTKDERSPVTSDGVTRTGEAVWVDLSTIPPTEKSVPVSTGLSFDDIRDAVKANPDKYLKLADAVDVVVPYAPKGGDTVATSSGNFKLGNLIGSNSSCISATASYPSSYQGSTVTMWTPGGTNQCAAGDISANVQTFAASPSVEPVTSTAPTHRDATNEELQIEISTGLLVMPEFQAELDKMMQDPNYIPTFKNSTTGQPFVPPAPSTVMTPQQIADYNTNANLQNAIQRLSSSSSRLTQSGTDYRNAVYTRVAESIRKYQESGGDPATGVGGDQSLYRDMLTAQADAAKARASTSSSSYTQAQQDAQDAKDAAEEQAAKNAIAGMPTNAYDSTVEAPEKKNITDLLTGFVNSSPLVNMVQSFTVTTSGASGVIPIGIIYGKQLEFDFTRWESTLRACGGVLLVIMHGFSVFIVVRGW